MGYLREFGVEIYRLKEVRESDEFLLYDIKNRMYNQYSFNRLLSILEKTLLNLEIDFKDFVKKVLGAGYKKASLKNFLSGVVEDEYILIDNIGYKPILEELFIENNKKYFNIYKKSDIFSQDILGNNFDNIKKLALNLVGGNKDEYDYLISWLAWKIQNPIKRLPTAIILQGEHGTGKSKFCELVLKPIFENNFCEIGQADINKDYNDYMIGKELIVANEVVHNDNKFLVPDKLKNYVTDEYVSINRKFKDTFYQRNYSQWIFITNNKVPLKIEKGDRRYSVFKSKKLKNGFDLISEIEKNHEKELLSFLNHLLNKEVNFEFVAQPLHNEAKEEIIKYGNNSVDDFMEDLKEYDCLDLLNRYDREIAYSIKKHEKGVIVPTHDIYKCYKAYCIDYQCKSQSRHFFTRYLKTLGFQDVIKKNEEEVSTRYIYFKNGWENNI